MKKYLSVFMLYTRSTLYKLLLIFILSSGAQIFFFYQEQKSAFWDLTAIDQYASSLSTMIYEAKVPVIFLIAYLLTLVLLMLTGLDGKGKMSYTIRRLSIPEEHHFFVQALYNTFAVFLLYGFEVITVYLIGLLFLNTAPESITSHQTLFINFYGNEFLHSLVPLDEISRWIRNLLIFFGLGFATAWHPHVTRRGKKHLKSIFYCVFVSGGFVASFGAMHNDLFFIFLSLIAIIFIAYMVIKKEVPYEN